MASGDLQAHPGMLALARESRGMTQVDVAAAMTKAAPAGAAVVSQGYVSRAESGRLVVADDRLQLYAAALGYPVDLLCLDPRVSGVGVGLIHHRKRASLSSSALRRIHAQLALVRLQVTGLVQAAAAADVPHRFSRVLLDDFTTAKDAARQVRRAWGLPRGPVADVIAAIEEAGGLVVMRSLGSELLDAVSQWDDLQVPLVLVNDHAPGDRCRFSVAHELGHLVMHPAPGTSSEQEKQADAFAAEFLMPAADIRQAFADGVDLARLAELKRVWRVSMSALLRRALTLNAITEWQYRTVMVEMSALGYRTAEPVEVEPERPMRVPALVEALLSDRGLAIDEAAACVRLLPEDFKRLYVAGDRSLSPEPLRR
ncbi:ImmA/IrrE family metallo-endopeptidase [Streptomyces sp. SLBN-115]|uniref:ImmA/IrrE family metallo-endopeptidase n=1 Tax=Streptomyces sp. SLBN-115 TaxID=2768453 RepID=UPI00116E6258|nr:ImmA/IrrE family metallo-endopeptidase [Streptomyces sp. SLBN-115]TQJ37997.1 Zn-dependent peptidase ImmA (M78 family) [Streptomyces sp. SLBN-115]